MAKHETVSPDKITFCILFLKHEANREAQHIFSAVEYKAIGVLLASGIGGDKVVGNIVETILEGEVEKYRADADTHAYHHAEVDGVDGLGDIGEGKLVEYVVTDVGNHEFSFGAHIERHSIRGVLYDMVTIVEGNLYTIDFCGDARMLCASIHWRPLVDGEGDRIFADVIATFGLQIVSLHVYTQEGGIERANL